MLEKISNLFQELKRRKVINTLVIYLAASWLLLQVISLVLPMFSDDRSFLFIFISFCALTTPVVVLLSWFYQITPKGLVKTQPFVERRRLNNISPSVDRRLGTKRHKNDPGHGWYIHAETGPVKGLEYPIDDVVVIGRALECEITLLRSYISRGQAKLLVKDNVLEIEDLGSSNGTRVNGTAVVGVKTLHHGDEISFKDVTFRVREKLSEFNSDTMLNQTMIVGKTE
ncbi:MAG: FHA domain-containing protein [Porticoccaceae bacterium]|nr:FHA domain-containing protein [Porticoccaceae bacterium]